MADKTRCIIDIKARQKTAKERPKFTKTMEEYQTNEKYVLNEVNRSAKSNQNGQGMNITSVIPDSNIHVLSLVQNFKTASLSADSASKMIVVLNKHVSIFLKQSNMT